MPGSHTADARPAPRQELKHRKSSAGRRREVLEEDEEATAQQHAAILADLRAQAARGEEEVEAERRLQHEIAKEVAELRGRFAHAAKEQAQWEQDLRAQEDIEAKAAMVKLNRLRKLRPDVAARLAAERSTGAPSGQARLL